MKWASILPRSVAFMCVKFLDGHQQGSSSRPVWQFIDHLESNVPLLRRRSSVDEALEVHFLNDHLVQGQAVFVGKHGLSEVGVGVVGNGVVVDKGNRDFTLIPLGDVHAPANTPADVDNVPLGLGRMVFVGRVGTRFHTLPNTDGTFLDKVFVAAGCLHQVRHQGVDFVLDHGVKRLLCLSSLESPSSKRKKGDPLEIRESPSLLGLGCGC